MAEMERRHALHFRAAELYWVTRDMTRVALDASTDMPPWTPSAVIPVPIGLLIWAEDLPRIVWRGHDGSPMVPVDGVLWEPSGGWIEFIVLTRTDRAITEGVTTSRRAPFITVHSVVLKADELVTDDDRYQAGLIAAIGATWTPDADAHRGHTPPGHRVRRIRNRMAPGQPPRLDHRPSPPGKPFRHNRTSRP